MTSPWASNGTYQRGLPMEQRFWSKVQGDDYTACWIWTAGTNRGYGYFNVTARRGIGAHRWAYEHLRGEIPEGLELDHLCRVRRCVNPWHLEPVTTAENVRRQKAAITHCPQGHLYDATNTYRLASTGRKCRTCNTENQRRFQAKRRALAGAA